MTRSDEIADNKAGVQAAVTAVVKVNAAISADHAAVAERDHQDHRAGTRQIADGRDQEPVSGLRPASGRAPIAIGTMMKDLHYISHDVSADIKKNMDYEFLMAATGKPKEQLGY